MGNGKDCKHEELELMSEDENALFTCCGKRCTKEFWESEVVILTKAQHQLTQAVVKKYREYMELQRGTKWKDRKATNKILNDLFDVLDALDKGE